MAIDDSTVLQQVAESLEAGEGAMDAIRIHEFEIDGDEHDDDDVVALLHQDFRKDFDAALKRSIRTLGMVSTVFFVGMAIFSAAIPFLGLDGPAKRPLLAAVILGSLWIPFSCLGIWFLVTYHKYRLSLSDTSLQQIGTIRSGAD